ncbi:MAG: hypothetical protein WC784_03170 [Candidatus Shapirobacteria bacterium]
MTEHFLKIPNQDLSLPKNCFSSEVIAVVYLRIPKVEKSFIFDIKCRNSNQCPIKTCQYQKAIPFKS